MSYKNFDIVQRPNGIYWIIACGYMIASATTIEAAKDYIDELSFTF